MSKLRTDGIYVQFGSRIWYNNGGTDTSDHWYNLIRIFDNGYLMFLGNAYIPFYDADDTLIETKGKRRHGHNDFNLSNPSDPLVTVHELMKLSKEEMLIDNRCGMSDGIEIAKYDVVEPEYCCDCVKEWEDQLLASVGYLCNDSCLFYFDSGNPLIFKDRDSPNRVEVNPNSSPTFYNAGTTRHHNFPAYFIPDDESEQSTWKQRYDDWMSGKKEEEPVWEEIVYNENEEEKHYLPKEKYIEEEMYCERTTYYCGECSCECHHVTRERGTYTKPDDWSDTESHTPSEFEETLFTFMPIQ